LDDWTIGRLDDWTIERLDDKRHASTKITRQFSKIKLN